MDMILWNLLVPGVGLGCVEVSSEKGVFKGSYPLFSPLTFTLAAMMSHLGGASPGNPLCEQNLLVGCVGLCVGWGVRVGGIFSG